MLASPSFHDILNMLAPLVPESLPLYSGYGHRVERVL